jgi:phosphate transport system substrate-binding protein
MMKTKSILVLLLLFSFGCGEKNNSENKTVGEVVKKELRIKGSDTMLPISQKESEEYMKADSLLSITVVGGGSGVGIAALLDGTTDLAMASRDLKTDEELKFQDKKITLTKTVVGFDALSVVVNPENKVSQLTREQLEDIFTGKIKNWKEVGGANEKIVVYSRESSSGTFEFFKENVMSKKNYASDVLSLASTGAIIQSVSQTKGAIGYVGMAYADNSVKTIGVSYDQGKTFVLPTVATAKDKTYPISRPLFYFYDQSKAPLVKSYMDYVLSAQGQKILSDVGYVSMN